MAVKFPVSYQDFSKAKFLENRNWLIFSWSAVCSLKSNQSMIILVKSLPDQPSVKMDSLATLPSKIQAEYDLKWPEVICIPERSPVPSKEVAGSSKRARLFVPIFSKIVSDKTQLKFKSKKEGIDTATLMSLKDPISCSCANYLIISSKISGTNFPYASKRPSYSWLLNTH